MSNNTTSTQFQSDLNSLFQTLLDKAISIATLVILISILILLLCIIIFCIIKSTRKHHLSQIQKHSNINTTKNNNTIDLENVSKSKAKQLGFQTLQDISNVPPNEGSVNAHSKDNMSLSEIRVKNMQVELKGKNNGVANNSNSGDSTEAGGDTNGEGGNGDAKGKKSKRGNKKGKRMNKGSSRISKMNMNKINVNDNVEVQNRANTEAVDKELDYDQVKEIKLAKTLITEKDMEDELKKQMNKYQFS